MTLYSREFGFFSLTLVISYITFLGFIMNCFPPQHEPSASAAVSGPVQIVKLISGQHLNVTLMVAPTNPPKPAACLCTAFSYVLLPCGNHQSSVVNESMV